MLSRKVRFRQPLKKTMDASANSLCGKVSILDAHGKSVIVDNSLFAFSTSKAFYHHDFCLIYVFVFGSLFCTTSTFSTFYYCAFYYHGDTTCCTTFYEEQIKRNKGYALFCINATICWLSLDVTIKVQVYQSVTAATAFY